MCLKKRIHSAWLAFGANLGDRFENIAGGIAYLSTHGVELVDCSSIYETKPVGYLDQPDFYNMVALVTTTLEPFDLLGVCQEAEQVFLRERSFLWGPRTLDIDILIFDDLTMDSPALTLPHPRMGERSFVLGPLEEIGGDVIKKWGYTPTRDGIELAIPARALKARVACLAASMDSGADV